MYKVQREEGGGYQRVGQNYDVAEVEDPLARKLSCFRLGLIPDKALI